MQLQVDEQIYLELTARNHAPALLELININRAHLSRFLPWVPHMQTQADLEAYIENTEALYRQSKDLGFVILVGQKVAGRIGLHYIDQINRSGFIGYWLGQEYEGRGIISRSCQTLVRYGFEELRLNRIQIKAAVQNSRSNAIPARLGFKQEGLLREAELVNGVFHDLLLYSLLRNEWIAGGC